MAQDQEHISLLATFHYVVAGIAALFSLFPVLHLAMGLSMVFLPEKFSGPNGANPFPGAFGWIFVAMASVFIVMGLAYAISIFFAAQSLRKRRHYMFCLVMGGVECVFFPFGTVLGVFTLIVLTRESVKELFLPRPGPPLL